MQAQRHPCKTDLLSVVNWLFDGICDCGFSDHDS